MANIIESIDIFYNDSLLLIDEWKRSNENVTNKTKILKENQTSIEILEKNLGNININPLKEVIKIESDNIKKEIDQMVELEQKLKDISQTCDAALKKLLEMHHNMQKKQLQNIDECVNDDVIGVSVAKTFWSDIDCHDLRRQPTINKECVTLEEEQLNHRIHIGSASNL